MRFRSKSNRFIRVKPISTVQIIIDWPGLPSFQHGMSHTFVSNVSNCVNLPYLCNRNVPMFVPSMQKKGETKKHIPKNFNPYKYPPENIDTQTIYPCLKTETHFPNHPFWVSISRLRGSTSLHHQKHPRHLAVTVPGQCSSPSGDTNDSTRSVGEDFSGEAVGKGLMWEKYRRMTSLHCISQSYSFNYAMSPSSLNH